MLNLNPFSIVARDPASGMFGVAASTRLPAVGVLVPYTRAGVGAIATQARTNPLLGYDGLDLLQRGYDAAEPLPERLVRALEAGQAAGGDKRGKQSAAVTTVKDQPYPYVDLRVDEHPDPVVELRRIYEVVNAQMLPFIEALPTRRNPKGDFGEEIRGALIPE